MHMFKLIRNNKNNNNIDLVEEFENFDKLLNYLFTTENFKSYKYENTDFLDYIQENEMDVLDIFESYNVPNSSKMADLFKAGKVTMYEAYNSDNGESKIIVTDDLTIPDINGLLSVYGETTAPAGVKNVFEVIE